MFLSNRKQYVSINGFESNKIDTECGVPQGSTLGPLLFLIYKLSKVSTQILYSKSFCWWYQSKKLKTLESNLNHVLKLCNEWLDANKIHCHDNITRGGEGHVFLAAKEFGFRM